MSVVHEPVAVPMSDHVHSGDFAWDGDGWILNPSTTDLDLTGCDPNSIAQSGQEFVIFNQGVNAVMLRHDSASSTAGMRLLFNDEQDHALDPGEMVWGVRWEGLTVRPDGWYLQF